MSKDGKGERGNPPAVKVKTEKQQAFMCFKVTNKSHSIFLESTYQMIDKSPAHVACWSATGDTFIVNDPAAFANTMIPMFFKHSKFSSFVRQLFRYGFRQLKVNDLLLPQEEKTWWEFHLWTKGTPEGHTTQDIYRCRWFESNGP
jgi:hypothetical protein